MEIIISVISFIFIVYYYIFTIERRLKYAHKCARAHRETIQKLIDGVKMINKNQIIIAQTIEKTTDIEFPFLGEEN